MISNQQWIAAQCLGQQCPKQLGVDIAEFRLISRKSRPEGFWENATEGPGSRFGWIDQATELPKRIAGPVERGGNPPLDCPGKANWESDGLICVN